MYRYCAIPRGDGQTPSEGLWRSGPSYIHGKETKFKKRIIRANITKECDLRNTPSIEESVRHSDVVYNLIGRMYPTKYVIMAHD